MDNKKGRLNALIAVRSLSRMSKSYMYNNIEKIVDKTDDDHMGKLLEENKIKIDTIKKDMHDCADKNRKKQMKNKTDEHVNKVNMKVCQGDAPLVCKREGVLTKVVKKEEIVKKD